MHEAEKTMFVVVAGCGRLGAGLAKVLSSQGYDVVVVGDDIDQKRLGGDFDGTTVQGVPIDEDVLKKAGIEKADLLAAVTSDDNMNVMITQVAKEIFHVPTVLARISDPEREEFYKNLGLNIVCPTNTGINQILNLIRQNTLPTLSGYIDPRVIGIKPNKEWVGKKVEELTLPPDRKCVGIFFKDQIAGVDSKRDIQKDDTLILVRKPLKRRRKH
jgi:trk system potassium uptake protein TrkA